MINKTGMSRHPCLVPDFGGRGGSKGEEAFSLLPLRMMLSTVFLDKVFTKSR